MIAHGDELRDKVVVVTGSTSGIGRAVALAFGERGACVVFNGRSPEKLSKVFNHAVSREIRGMAVLADVATTAGANRLINAAFRRFGRVDVLVNNAGAGGPSPKPFWTLIAKHWTQPWQSMSGLRWRAPVPMSKGSFDKRVLEGSSTYLRSLLPGVSKAWHATVPRSSLFED